MSKIIQIRNVPDDVHKTLKVRAAKEGLSLSDFLKREFEKIISWPSIQEVIERIRSREKVPSKIDSVKAVREIRKSIS